MTGGGVGTVVGGGGGGVGGGDCVGGGGFDGFDGLVVVGGGVEARPWCVLAALGVVVGSEKTGLTGAAWPSGEVADRWLA